MQHKWQALLRRSQLQPRSAEIFFGPLSFSFVRVS
jgi:hypothetical protein